MHDSGTDIASLRSLAARARRNFDVTLTRPLVEMEGTGRSFAAIKLPPSEIAMSDETADYLRAFTPDAVLALLDQIESLRKIRDAARVHLRHVRPIDDFDMDHIGLRDALKGSPD